MSIFFRLPVELIDRTLSFVPTEELQYLFELRSLLFEPIEGISDPYLTLRHMALLNYYQGKNLILTNNVSFLSVSSPTSLNISINELCYLLGRGLIIRPKDISFILFNIRDDPSKFLSYIQVLFQTDILNYLKTATENFNVQIVLARNRQMINQLLIKNLFTYLNGLNYKINWFKIRYTGEGNHLEDSNYSNLTIQNLQLHLFNSQRLITHLSQHSSCLLCDNLKSLDLSFNALNDLSSIKFPPSLTNLNLSNNSLIELNNFNFNWKNLVNLESLDLSNNNLLRIVLPFRDFQAPYKLSSVDFSGNNLMDLSFLSKTPLFQNLEDINLSRNLITHLCRFPESVRNLNLTGNYLVTLLEQLNGKIFPSSLQKLDLSCCKVDGPYCTNEFGELERMYLTREGLFELVVGAEHLANIQWLNLEGNNFPSERSETQAICEFQQ
ncbi:uncharacterized protein RJT20DRAFT_60715 [Scheffersomyces xylosifermentans]|uniref:uncharacterized protein n=1 Tax=Scheffersomyces xylosifermentans TaxID=1304137 RepID=UPI00315C6617